METVNPTSIASLREWLGRTQADVICVQELRADEAMLLDASRWLGSLGWNYLWTPSVRTEAGGLSAGAAILARDWLALRSPYGGSVVVPSRAVAGALRPPGFREFVIYSLYCWCSEGASERNKQLLASVGAHAQAHGLGICIGADFNMLPAVLCSTGFEEALGAKVVAPDGVIPTCTAGRRGTVDDYFLLDLELVLAVDSIEVRVDSGIAPHRPVRLSFKPWPVDLLVLKLKKPEPLPLDPPFGPRGRPVSCPGLLAHAKDLERLASDGHFARADEGLQWVYQQWALQAETNLVGVLGLGETQGALRRGADAAFSWQSVLPQGGYRSCKFAKVSWRKWVADRASEAQAWLEAWWTTLEGAWLLKVQRLSKACSDRPPQPMVDCPLLSALLQDLVCRLDGIAADALALASELGSDLELRWSVLERWDAVLPPFVLWAGEQRAAADIQVAQLKAEGSKEWKQWCQLASGKGAKAAHRFSQAPTCWKPSVAVTRSSAVPAADPFTLLLAEGEKYEDRWQATFAHRGRIMGAGTSDLPRLTVAGLRDASMSFKRTTAVSYDGFRMRHYALLDDEVLEVLVAILTVCEMVGDMPGQLRRILFTLLPKPKGGFRPIAIFVSLYRLWARARRQLVAKWMASFDRPYFLCGKGRSLVDGVWRQAVRSEAGVAAGSSAALVLWDMDAFFERFDLRLLQHRLLQLQAPASVARLALNVYTGARHIGARGVFLQARFSWHGLPAGCQFADAFVKAYLVGPLDGFVARNPLVHLADCVDDLGLEAQGPPAQVEHALIQACADLQGVIERELKAVIAIAKSAISASTVQLARRLRSGLGALGGECQPSVVNLGVDFAAGVARGRCKGTKLAARWLKTGQRAPRIRALRLQSAKAARAVVVAGVRPSLLYGVEVRGASPLEMQRLQRLAVRELAPCGGGKARTLQLVLEGDPMWYAAVAPILQWCKEAWRAFHDRAGGWGNFDPVQLSKAWAAVCPCESASWRNAKGPLALAWLSAQRIGWRWPSPWEFVDDLGRKWCITQHSPAMMRRALRSAWQRHLERKAARILGKAFPGQPGQRITLEHFKDWASRRAKKDKVGPFIVKGVLLGTRWTAKRAADAGYDTSGLCSCGAPDTAWHRTWQCPHHDDARGRAASLEVQRRAQEEGPSSLLFSLGILPHPADHLPRPASEGSVTKYHGNWPQGKDDLAGSLFSDGSAVRHRISELSRAGWAVVLLCPDTLAPLVSIAGPVWSPLDQTAATAEMVAISVAHQFAVGECRVWSDNANAVRLFSLSALQQVRGGSPFAGIAINHRRYPDAGRVLSVQWTKAHRSLASLVGEELFLATGNSAADAEALAGRLHHPVIHGLTEVDASIAMCEAVWDTIAEVWREYPARLPRGRPPGRSRACPQRRLAVGHLWRPLGCGWRCAECWRWAATRGQRGVLDRAGCDKPAALVGRLAAASVTHRIVDLEVVGDAPLYLCVLCGCWSQRRAYGLAAPCRRRPLPAGLAAVRKVVAGRHPVAGALRVALDSSCVDPALLPAPPAAGPSCRLRAGRPPGAQGGGPRPPPAAAGLPAFAGAAGAVVGDRVAGPSQPAGLGAAEGRLAALRERVLRRAAAA